jgi:hypothetical protein
MITLYMQNKCGLLIDLCLCTDGKLIHTYANGVMRNHNNKKVVIYMGYGVGGVGAGSCAGYGGMGAAAFVLVLFILLIIILRAGTGY